MRKQCVGTVKDGTRGLLHPLWLHVVESETEVEPYLGDVVGSYKEIFAEPPYNEDYSGQEESYIKPSFRRFAEHGVLVLLLTGEMPSSEIVGFGGSDPADLCEASEFLLEHQHFLDVPLSQHLYMAELGVRSRFRHQGLGSWLVTLRMDEARINSKFGFTHVIMRTAREGSHSKRLYERLGATVVEDLVQFKDGFATASNERIFLTMPLR